MADVIGQKDLKKPQGTGFTNLQRILGASQGSALGSTIGGAIQQQGQKAQQAIGQVSTGFEQKAETARLDKPEARTYRQGVLAQPKAVTDEDVKKFEQFRSGQYAGPRQLETSDVQNLQGQAREAAALGRQTMSTGGRLGLLQRYAGAPSYTGGQQKLDQLILGQTGKQPLTQARRETLGLEGAVAQAGEKAVSLGDYLQKQAQAFKGETEQAIGSRRGELYQPLQQRVTESQQAEEKRLGTFEKLKDLLRQDNPQEALQLAQQEGLIGGGYAERAGDLYGRARSAQMNLADLLSQQLTQERAEGITAGGLATAEEQAQLNALSRLAGQSPELAQIGGFKAGRTTFDPNVEARIAQQEQRIAEEAARANQWNAFFEDGRIVYRNMSTGETRDPGQSWQGSGITPGNISTPQSNPDYWAGSI